MRIAHLILAHQDPIHIARLAHKLSSYSDVYIHIDVRKDITLFVEAVGKVENIFFLQDRLSCEWGGWNSVAAEILLLKQAIHKGSYDRFVFLQGADYPIKSGKEIRAFFEAHKDVEFIRGCCCTTSDDYYLRCRCWSIWFYNNYSHFTLLKKIWNRLTKQFKIELRNGFAYGDNLKHPVYWGSAQWAITKGLAVYFIEFFDNHPNYNKWYYNAFPADEIYFTTIAFNSPFRNNTTAGGPEPELRGLANWRNLHYFEYLPGRIKVFEESDITLIRQLEELYIRKVTTEQSSKLLDLIDYSERE